MLVEQIYKLYDKEEKPRDRDYFFISEVSKCPIAIFYSFKKVAKAKLEPQTYLKFEEGNNTHKSLVEDLFKLGIVKAVEISIPENELFKGRADAIVSIENQLYVVEIKSVNNRTFEKLVSEGKPDAGFLMQIQLYLFYFNIDRGIILIKNKDTQELREFIVKKDMELINNILTYFEMLKQQIINDELPDKPENLPRWKCGYCPYGEICEKNTKKQPS